MIVEIQLRIILYKEQLKENPSCEATKALLGRNRLMLKELV